MICFTIRCHLSVGTLPITNLLHCDSTPLLSSTGSTIGCSGDKKTLHQLITVPQQSVGQNIIIIGAVTSRRRDEWTTASPSVLSFLSSPLHSSLRRSHASHFPRLPGGPQLSLSVMVTAAPCSVPLRHNLASEYLASIFFFWSDGHLGNPLRVPLGRLNFGRNSKLCITVYMSSTAV